MRATAIVAGFLLLSAPALAEPAENQTPILRCLVATNMLAQNKESAVATAGLMGSLYFLGRLDPALEEVEAERQLIEMITKLDAAELQRDLERCGAEMKTKGAMLQRIGQKIKAVGGESGKR